MEIKRSARGDRRDEPSGIATTVVLTGDGFEERSIKARSIGPAWIGVEQISRKRPSRLGISAEPWLRSDLLVNVLHCRKLVGCKDTVAHFLTPQITVRLGTSGRATGLQPRLQLSTPGTATDDFMPPASALSRAERPPGYDIVKYEDGMQILYDVLSKGVFIQLRGKSGFLKAPFQSSGRRYALRRTTAESSGWGDSRPQ